MDRDLNEVTSNKYKRNVDYYVPKDLGYTFGTVYKNLQTWLEHELKGVVKFNHLYIDTRVNYDKEFMWNRGLLGQARKPTLALQFALELNEQRDPWNVPAFKNLDAPKYLNYKDFTQPMFMFEDDNDFTNTMEVRFGMKNVKCTLNAGIATVTRMEAINIANYWNTRRSDGFPYNLMMTIDFKIPPVIIYIICKKFNINMRNHHEVLKFLNKNSNFTVFYGMDGNNAKFYYFIRYKTNFIIKPESSTVPQGWEVIGTAQANTWTFNRQFDLDIQIPYIIALNKYGDRINFEEYENILTYDLVEDHYNSKASINYNERILEIERVITDKHAVKQINFQFQPDNLIKINEDVMVSEKLDLTELWKDDEYLKRLIKWATTKRKYTYLDLFNFKLYRIDKHHQKKDSTQKELEEIDFTLPINDPDSMIGSEYEGYVKNIKDMYVVDINPTIDAFYVGILYLNLEIENEYKRESGEYYDREVSNSDFGITHGLGKNNKNIRVDYDALKNSKDWY